MKKPSIIKSIFSFLLKVIVVVLIMACIGLGSFQGVTKYITGSFYDFKEAAEKKASTEASKEETEEAEVDEKSVENSLLFVDSQDGMYEYVILTMLNTDTNAMDFLFLPENGQVQVSKSIQKKLSKKIDGISGSVEFRAIERAYSGKELYDTLSDVVSEMLNLRIAGWDHMTYQNAVDFIDSVKYVPITLDYTLTYRDQDGILNKIESGENELNGTESMAFVSHLDGSEAQESNRLERTNTFMEQFLTRLTKKLKASEMMEAYQSNLESSSDKRSFDQVQEAFQANSGIDFITLRILQGSESGDIFAIDSQKAQLQISTLQKQAASYSSSSKLGNDSDDDSDEEDDEDYSDDSKDLSIEIYNAAYVQGIASEWEYYLEDEGYHITLVDTYQQEGPISTTRIVCDKDGIGEDLLKYFPGAEMSVGDIDTGGDIQIYVGTDATTVGASE